MKCLSCGVDKDLSVEVTYPYPEDECLCDDPIPQLLTIECQDQDNHLPDGSWNFRMAIICHECWHRLVTTIGIDLWIGRRCWESLNPITAFSDLPEVLDDLEHDGKWDARNYDKERT